MALEELVIIVEVEIVNNGNVRKQVICNFELDWIISYICYLVGVVKCLFVVVVLDDKLMLFLVGSEVKDFVCIVFSDVELE